MNKKWLGVGAIALIGVLGVFGLTGCNAGTTADAATGDVPTVNISNQQQGIWVSGEGQVKVTPDIATLNIGVDAQDTTVSAAREQAASAMQAVMDALTANGVDSKDIQTTNFSIYQTTKYDNNTNEQVVTGYRVSNTVTVTIRNIDNVGTIIDSAANAGGDYTRINGINFSVDDPSPYYTQARQDAMADAKTKAQALADLSGVTLGGVTYVTESSSTPPVIYRNSGAVAGVAMDTSTSVSPGELDITVNVQVGYAIQ